MTQFAAVVLAHADPDHLRRLVDALDHVPIFLHVDANTGGDVARSMVAGLPPRVRLLDRRATSRASWSLVDAELRGLRCALETTGAEHIAIMSGADYPLVSMEDLVRELSAWRGESYMWNTPMPFPRWDTDRFPDGGLWRLRHRFMTRRDQVVYLGKFPLRLPIQRPLFEGIEARACSQWKVLGRRHAEHLLEVVDERPELVRYWRSTLVPEESFVASVLGSRSLLGADALPPCDAQPWFIRWTPGDTDHPAWLTDTDFPDLARARRRDSLVPEETRRPWDGGENRGRQLFARKFSTTRSGGLSARIDAELRT
jgi:Core-2/I-Branching enzyme